MNESEFQSVEGSGEAFRDFGDPEADMKQAKPIIAARIIVACVFLLISSSIDASDSAAVSAIAQPATLEVWPAGTRLVIPNKVMGKYQEESDSWSYPSVYLFANYFFTGSFSSG